MQLVHDHLVKASRRNPDAPAIICGDVSVTYRQLLVSVDGLSEMIADEGVANGDRVVIVLRNKIDFLVTSYAVMKIGGIAVPIPDDTALFAVQQLVADCAPSLVVTSASDLLEHPRLRSIVECDMFLVEASAEGSPYAHSVGLRARSNGVRTARPIRPPKPGDGALILYTSGTGAAKNGVLLSHTNLIRASRIIIEFTGINTETREFVTTPLTRSFGLAKCWSLHVVGGTVVLNDGPLDPVSMVQSMLRHRSNAFSVVPSAFTNMFGHLESLVQRIGSQVRHIELGSSSMTADQKRHFMGLFPNARICMHYGCTEAPRTGFLDFRKEHDKLDTVGSASPDVEIAVLDERGAALEPGSTGEIATRGGHVMVGYWNNEPLTRTSKTSDGWFKTGDFGFLDEGGYLHLVGRRDEMISMDGVTFSTLEIEEHVRELYPEHELCVVGVPDPAGILGEIPVLCYIGRNGKTIAASDLSRLLADRVDRTKIPRLVFRIEPDSAQDGLLVRENVRKQFMEEFAAPILEHQKKNGQ